MNAAQNKAHYEHDMENADRACHSRQLTLSHKAWQ